VLALNAIRVFVITFLSTFIALLVTFDMLIPFYYGHPLIDWGRYTEWWSSYYVIGYLLCSLIVAVFSVLAYELYKLIKKKW